MLNGKYYTPEELAKKFQLSLSTIYNLIDRGELPSVKLGKCYRIPEDQLSRYLDKQLKGAIEQGKSPEIGVVNRFVKLLSVSQIQDKISEVILYGSYVRGDFNSDSDIDVLVVLKKAENTILDLVSELSEKAMEEFDYQDFLSVIQLSEKQWQTSQKLNTPFYKAIDREGISLWKK